MAIEHIAIPLYCYRLLLKITLLSFYRVTVLIPYSMRISDFCDHISKTKLRFVKWLEVTR